MEEQNEQNDDNLEKRSTFFKRILRNFYPFFLIFSSISLIIIITLMLLAKTQTFRHWSSGLILNLVNDELQEGAKFEFDDINFSYLLGFKINNARIIVRSDTLLNCKELHAGLNVIQLLRNRIFVNEILIIEPRINVFRSSIDSLWNFEKVFLPSLDTTPTEPLNWLIKLRRIRMKDGKINYYDSTQKRDLSFHRKIDYNHFYLYNLNLNINGELNLAKNHFKIDLDNVSFKEKYSKAFLKELSLAIEIDTTGINVDELYMLTAKSELNIKAEYKSINIFGESPNFKKAKFKLITNSESVSIDEIAKFIPADIPVTSVVGFDIIASGSIDKFKVNAKKLQVGNSKIEFNAYLKNITDDERVINLNVVHADIYEEDLNRLLAPLNITGIPKYNFAKIYSLNVVYKNNTISADFNFESNIGIAKGNTKLDFNDKFIYEGKITTENINIANITNNNDLKSNINANIEFQGSGVALEDIDLKLDVDIKNSTIIGYEFSKAKLNLNTSEPGVYVIDSLFIELARKYDTLVTNPTRRRNSQSLFVSGLLDLKNADKPKYNLHAKFGSLRPARLFDNSSLPTVVDASLSINCKGIELDDIVGDINFKVDRWRFARKQLKPFELAMNIKHPTQVEKSISIKSDILNLEVQGVFSMNALVELLNYNVAKLNEYVQEKIVSISGKNIGLETSSILLKQPYDNMDLKMNMEFKDIEYIRAFMGFEEFKVNMVMDLGLTSTRDQCKLDITKLKIDNFIFQDSTQSIRLSPINMSGEVEFNYSNNSYKPQFELAVNSKEAIFIDKLFIEGLHTDISLNNDVLKFSGSANINDQFTFSTDFTSSFFGKRIDLEIDSLSFKYTDKLNMTIAEKVSLSYENEVIDIKNFKLTGKNLKLIELSGKASMDKFDNLTIKISDYNIDEVWRMIPQEDNQWGNMIKGNIDSLYVIVNGSKEDTDIKVKLSAENLQINGHKLGNLNADLVHKNAVISGTVDANYITNTENRNLLNLNIIKIPLNLSIDTKEERFAEDKPIAVSFTMNRFPLDYLSPFVSGINKLHGFADINLDISGNDFKNIKYSGFINYDKTSFLLDFNNMNFTSEGKIVLRTDSIMIEKITLKNDNSDLSGGEAIVKGSVILDNMKPKYFDLKMYSKKIKILNQASMKSMPTMYGDFIISFGPGPLHISGTLDEPNVRGDLNILRATLNMPNSTSTEVKKSRLKYEYKNENQYDFTFVDDPLKKSTGKVEVKEKNEESKSFVDQLDIDIGIRFLGRFIVTMGITEIGQLFAEIGTPTSDDVLRYVDTRSSEDARIYGTELQVKSGSTLKLIKMLDTKGNISFPTGLIDNPSLDLTAIYQGTRFLNDKQSDYTVNMYIKGTKESPNITFGYSIDDIIATGDSSKINEDAILLLTIGKRKEELTAEGNSSGDNNKIMSTANSMATSMASSMASSALTDFVQSTGIIQSADIDIGNSLTSFDQAKMKFSGDIKGIKWTLGGTVADFANNNEISIDMPLPINFDINWLNHFVLQLTATTNSTQSTTSKNQKDWEVKFKFGGSW